MCALRLESWRPVPALLVASGRGCRLHSVAISPGDSWLWEIHLYSDFVP